MGLILPVMYTLLLNYADSREVKEDREREREKETERERERERRIILCIVSLRINIISLVLLTFFYHLERFRDIFARLVEFN